MTFMRRFLGSLFGAALAVFLLFGTVNPFGWFWGTRFLTTTPVTRAKKISLFEAWSRKEPIPGLVMGSSQSMKLDPELLSRRTGLRYFNLAVSQGTIEDDYALLDYLAERRAPVRELILGVDAWMFNPGTLPAELLDDWILAPRVYGRRPSLLWNLRHGAHLFANSLTLSYANEVLASINATRHHLEPSYSFLDNGYLEYRGRDREKAAGTYDLDGPLKRCYERLRNSTRASATFDSTRFPIFERALERARERGIAVTVWITPRFPGFYRLLDSLPWYRRWHEQAADSIHKLATVHGALFVDLRDSDRFGGDSTDWYDCQHYGATNAARIVERLLEFRADAPPKVNVIPGAER